MAARKGDKTMADKNLKESLKENKFHKNLRAIEAWREIIDEEIPLLMCLDGLVTGGCYDVIPVYTIIDYWYNKYQGGYTLEWTSMLLYEDHFMAAWKSRHHPALGVKPMKYGNKVIPCVYVKRRKQA